MRVLFCSILILTACAAQAEECKYSAQRNLDIDPAGLRTLVLQLGSSDAHVRGVAGLTKIEVRGKACASEQSRLARLTVEQSRSGDTVTVTPQQANEQTFNLFGSRYAYIDLDVRLPATLALAIKTHSGDADVADVATLDYSSHSGDLILNHVRGDVALDTHSGDVRAADIGNLTVRRSGSGDVHADKVRGGVEVGHVGSGDLGFNDVDKGVHVASIGSGDVNTKRVAGDVVVDAIGSGDIDVDGVGGNFTVKSAGSGDIDHRNVKGKVDVPRRDD
jgi:DUF4097 and DUF4098 domain-containing protein YvlB